MYIKYMKRVRFFFLFKKFLIPLIIYLFLFFLAWWPPVYPGQRGPYCSGPYNEGPTITHCI